VWHDGVSGISDFARGDMCLSRNGSYVTMSQDAPNFRRAVISFPKSLDYFGRGWRKSAAGFGLPLTTVVVGPRASATTRFLRSRSVRNPIRQSFSAMGSTPVSRSAWSAQPFALPLRGTGDLQRDRNGNAEQGHHQKSSHRPLPMSERSDRMTGRLLLLFTIERRQP
jgi:hypothetical protein